MAEAEEATTEGGGGDHDVRVFDDTALDLVDSVRAVVLANAAPGKPYPGGANRGGWKSRTDFLTWRAPVLWELCERFEAALGDGHKIGASWAMVNKLGSHHGRHRHGRRLSGLYFLSTGDPPVPTIFERTGRADLMVEPKVGRLVLFGDLFHFVPTYPGSEPRVTIAFDVKM